jgi:hypothetical protein
MRTRVTTESHLLVSLNSFSTLFGTRRPFREEPVLGCDSFGLLPTDLESCDACQDRKPPNARHFSVGQSSVIFQKWTNRLYR